MNGLEREKENFVVLSFGANLGDRKQTIEKAYQLLEQRIGRLTKKSSFFETEPWGFASDNLFINSVACFTTRRTCQDVLEEINDIEYVLGRKRSGEAGYQSRTIDIDILFFNDEVIESKDLIVPHPLLHKRNFVLQPLKEILSDFVHPVLGKRVEDITVS